MSKISKKETQQKSSTRRALMKGSLGLGAASFIWHKPIINSIVLPVHAQMSQCPMIAPGNITQQAGSGQPSRCTVEFEIHSLDSTASVEILSITHSDLGPNDEVSYPTGTTGAATSTSGPRVVWLGEAAGAPFSCQDPINEVVFTITYNCAANSEQVQDTFSLQTIAAAAPDI